MGDPLQKLRDFSKVRRLDTNLIFPAKNNPQKVHDFRRRVYKALRDANIESYRPWHDNRHTSASYLAMQGVSLHTIGIILGNKTVAKRYAHLSPDHLRDSVSALEGVLFKK